MEYIRVGTNKKNLKEYPDKERELWQAFDTTPYELRLAKSNVEEDELVVLLDYPKYYDKMEMPIPRNRDKVLDDLQNEKFIIKNDAGNWNITNMGALMIAKDLKKFDNLHLCVLFGIKKIPDWMQSGKKNFRAVMLLRMRILFNIL